MPGAQITTAASLTKHRRLPVIRLHISPVVLYLAACIAHVTLSVHVLSLTSSAHLLVPNSADHIEGAMAKKARHGNIASQTAFPQLYFRLVRK